MEIYSDSLVINLLLACAIPFMLIGLIILGILTTRSRLKEVQRIRSNLENGEFFYFKNYKSASYLRIISAFSLIFILVLLTGFLLFYWYFSSVKFETWVEFAILIPAICSIISGGGILLFAYFKIFKRGK